MNINKLKREIIPFLIAYIIIDLVIVGSLVLSLNGASEAVVGFDKFNSIINNFLPNIVSLKFFSVFVVDFAGFMSASFWTLIIFVILFIAWKIKFSKQHEYDGVEHGSSEWSKSGEEFNKQPDGSEILNRKNGFILSRKHFLGTDLRKVKINKNVLVVGGSGTGKTACYIKPNILQCLGSYVITDPKGELYRETSGFLKANGYNVRVFNLVNPDFSDRYNPLAHIIDHASVDIIAHTIVSGGSSNEGKSNDPFWDNTAKMLLKACIYYVISVLPEEEQNLSSCLNIVRQGGADESIFDKLFIDELKPEHPGRREYESIRLGADKTKQSIAISLTSKLSAFDTPPMQRITTSNNIDFEELGNKNTALYVITSAADSTYDYISTIFFSQMLQKMYTQADKNGGSLNNQVYFLLDEFANIGQIQDFNKKLSTTRSLGISISIIVQSLDQLEGLYKENYENIIGNCDTHLFLGSQSLKTCEYFSKSLGEKTIKYNTKSISKDKNEREKQGVSINTQIQGRSLMTADELKKLNPDKELILIRSLKPIEAEKAWYYRYHPQYKNAMQYEIHNESEMPRTDEVPICTMDIYEHLKKRENAAKERLNNLKLNNVDIDIEMKNNNKTENNNNSSNNNNSGGIELLREDLPEETNKSFDLQKELEKKFDELFGK